MSEPYLAEIRQVGFNFAPRGWAQCDGQLLQIVDHTALFSLLGTTYGGDGRTIFGLPELRGRAAMHEGSATGGPSGSLGQKLGQENVVLNINQVAQHDHQLLGTDAPASLPNPGGALLAEAGRGDSFIAGAADKQMDARSVSNAGGSQGHNNMQPFQAVNFIIALQGLFPPRN